LSLIIPPIYVLSDNDYEMTRLKKDVASDFINIVMETLREEDINFTGDLSTSMSLVIIGNDVSVETNNPYAHLVEFGMSPGKSVNYDALHDWVRIKLNVPDELVDQVTWKIWHKIKEKGIEPTRFWKRSILKLVKRNGSRTARKKKIKKSKHTKVFKSLKNIFRVAKKIGRYMKKIIPKAGKMK
jgi:hypothetical protein